MFTEATRQFGSWRVGHPSIRRYSGKPTQSLLLAYGFCAFLTWLIFILTLKIRGEFFLVEGMNIPLHSVASSAVRPLVRQSAGLSLVVQSTGVSGRYRVVLDSGESYLLPPQMELFSTDLKRRTDSMELTGLLRKEIRPGLGTAILWVDRQLPFEDITPVAKLLVSSGFDTLGYAVEANVNQSRGEP